MAQMNPSPSKPVVRYPTALLEDKELVTIHDSRLPDYKALEYGTPYFDQNKFPGLKLVFQEPLGEDDRMVRRVWAGDRQDQDLYNADRKYSGGSPGHPILIRRYLLPEEDYAPLPTGTPDSQFPQAVLVQEEVAQPENRNGYLAVTRVFETIPGPLLTGQVVTDKGQVAITSTQVVSPDTVVTPSALVISASVKPDSEGKSILEKVEVSEVFSEARFTAEKPEVVPTQFRAAVPEETTDFVEIGEAEMPVLDQEGDKAASQEQLTKFTRRVRRVRRDLSNVSESLEETNVDEAGIVETITKTLKTGPQTVDPSATVRGQVEELGDGLTLKTEVEKAKIFGGKVLTAERPDPVPEKFRVAVPTKTVEETVTGTATDPVLEGGEIAESEQQVTEFTKRTRKVTRDASALPKTLTQTATTNEGIKASISETLQTGDTSANPSARVSIESEAIGDGTYVIRTTTLPEIFDAKSFAIENPDPVPQKFRISSPSTTTEEIVEGTAAQPALAAGELAATEQQVTKFTKRKRKTSRSLTDLPKWFTQTATTNEGLKATITETLQTGDTADTPTALKSVESEAMGDGTYVVRKTELPEVFSGKVHAAEVPDPLPQKFRVGIPATTTEETTAGTAASPTLAAGDLAASEQQVTKHTKRTRKTSRSSVTLPKSFEQTATTNEGIKATITETLQSGNTGLTPSAKVSVESEAIGDGSYIVRKTELSEVFSGKVFTAERPDLVPEKFRIPTVTTESISEGDASNPTLDGDELASLEQQVTKFTKRTRKTVRALGGLPKSLTQTSTTAEGVKATITETLQAGDTNVAPSATTSVESQALGNNVYVVKQTTLDKVFSAKRISSEKPSTIIPERFRAASPDVTVSKISAGQIPENQETLTLQDDEISRSETQVSEHVKRVEKVVRDVGAYPILSGQDLDKTLNAPIPYIEAISETEETGEGIESTPLDDKTWLVRTTNVEAIKDFLTGISFQLETEAQIRLPDVMDRFEVHWETSNTEGGGEGEVIETSGGGGWAGVWTQKTKTDSAFVSVAIRPTFAFSVRRGYSGPAVAVQHVFFSDDPQNEDFSRFGAPWPQFEEAGATLVFTGKSKSQRKTNKWVRDELLSPGGGDPRVTEVILPLEDTVSEDVSHHIAEVPACLHTNFSFSPESNSAQVTKGNVSLQVSVTGAVSGSLDATSPVGISGGTYIISRSYTPYSFGIWKISVVTVNISPYI